VANTPLTRGDRGPRVAELQRALIAAGVAVRGGADGIFGAATAQALATFQTSKGLQPVGTLDVTTAHLLGLGPAPALPRRGERGDAVVALQRALIAAGVTVRGGADGVFGGATETAVSSFQSTRKMTTTGQVDVRTAIALGIAPQGAPASNTQNTNTQNTNTQNTNTAAQTSSTLSTTVALPRRGQTGDDVAVLQRALVAAGANVRGGADGVFGPATENALKIYQHGVRRPATGTLDEITARLLGLLPAPVVPRRGDRGDAVVAVQRALISLGVTVRGGADGVFGAATENAISTFQTAQGLTVTGRLDLVTFYAITSFDATAPGSPSPASTSTSSTSTPATSNASTTTTSPIQAQIFPVQGPCWFTDTWHAPRSGGRRHLGVDIIAPTGKAVYAVADGIITRTFQDRPGSLGGNALRLTAPDGTYFHYAHFSTFADGIELGTEVVAGQIIGYVGSTGSSSTPHLHFEYHPFGGAAVNPFPMVKKLDACKVVDVLPQPGAVNSPDDSSSGSSNDS
jgi:peptidoglycan hydrolase-like protein with peptidoglycan-binding domain